MSFYKSGFRRVLGKASTTRAKVDGNTKDDATLKAAVDVNTAKTGITPAQAGHITTNNSKVSMVIGTGAEQAMAGNTSTIARATTANAVIPTGGLEGTMTFTVSEGYLIFSFGGMTFSIRAN